MRDAAGVVWYIRNGEIVRIGNKSQGWATASIDIPIAGDQPVEPALDVLRDVVDELDGQTPWTDKLLERPEVLGVESIGPMGVTLRVLAKCVPGEQYAVSREVRERTKTAFERHGVRGPNVPTLPGA